jgi:fatty-acyl-CoA synthase
MYQLLINNILQRAVKLFPHKQIYSRDFSSSFTGTYRDMYERVCRLANVLESLGIKEGDKVATLAWNSHRHLELYLAVPCMGAVLHTLNIRLFTDQLAYVINHGEDKVIFIDEDVVPVIEGIKDEIGAVKQFVIMTDKDKMPETTLSPIFSYEDLLKKAPAQYSFSDNLDENSPAVMCYTTGTTGLPKGCVFSHRNIYLHSIVIALPDAWNISEDDTIINIVPMFHAMAWGIPYAATWLGAKQVFPGSRPDARTLCQLIQEERVTFTGAVPTVLEGMVDLLDKEKFDFSSLKRVDIGGQTPALSLVEALEERGVHVINGYGMTETCPLLTTNTLKGHMQNWSSQQKYSHLLKQGLPAPGVDWRVINTEGREVERNGTELGQLLVRAPWIIEEYYKEPEKTAESFKDGWLYTRDMVTVNKEGYIKIADRLGDLIKSGGEWISSIDLEDSMKSHPAIHEVAVVGVPHPHWGERPIAFVSLKQDFKGKTEKATIINFLEDKVAKWQIPDDVVFMEEVPKTSVGKIDKKLLRENFIRE